MRHASDPTETQAAIVETRAAHVQNLMQLFEFQVHTIHANAKFIQVQSAALTPQRLVLS